MNLDKFLGTIFGVAVGDALGMPFETMSAEEIKEKGGVPRIFVAPSSVNSKSFPSIRSLPAGSWTDDTQLTLATMEALIESGGRFDMDAIARKHVNAYLSPERRGWGRSTRNSCKRLSEGMSWLESGEPGGSGNGVVMKIAPLGLRSALTIEEDNDFVSQGIEFAQMTHLAPSAITAGGAHAYAIGFLARRAPDGYNAFLFMSLLREVAKLIERKFPPSEEKISDQVSLILSLHASGELQRETPVMLAARFGGGTKAAFSAYNSFGLSYAMFFRKPDSFDAVYNVIAAGGDTDSNASIVGSLLGALHGEKIVPSDFIRQVERSEWIRERTETFYNVCVTTKNNAP